MKAKRSPRKGRQDRISTLPQPLIEIILCLLPIEEAVRTSILSREWRYKWTTIPKLAFVSKRTTVKNQLFDLEQTSGMANDERREKMDMLRCKLSSAMHQVLLMHQGPIHEFALSVETTLNGYEIDQIILHLSRNHTIKKLTLDLLDNYDYILYKLPLSVFSLNHLTDLRLKACAIDHKPIFNGFGSLTSLYLSDIMISKAALLHLLSNCPSLTRLSLLMHDDRLLDYNQFIVTELFNCLPVIEHLTICGHLVQDFIPDSVKLQTMIHLKYFCYKPMGFVTYSTESGFLAVLIKCSPNLEKLKIEVDVDDGYDDEDADEMASIVVEDYSDVWLEHLNELEIYLFRNYKPEFELLKIILAKSPNLKQVRLITTMSVDEDELLETLSRTPCASQVVITVN